MASLLGTAICQACTRYAPPNTWADPPVLVGTCEAFPEGIPVAIRTGGDHRTPVEGDGGVVFELEPGMESWLQAWEIDQAS